MTPQQIVGICLRLVAIWLLLGSVPFLASIPGQLQGSGVDTGSAPALSYLIGSFYILAAVLLWFFPMVAAHKLVPKTFHDNKLWAGAVDLARVGCSLVGLWLLTKALPSLVWFVFRSYLANSSGSSFDALTPDAKAELAVSLFELVMAVAFIVKAGAFARLVVQDQPPRADGE